MMTKIQSKKIQIPQNSEKLFLAKCLVEQQLEQIQKSTQVSLKGNTDDGSVLFRVVKTKEIAAVAINGNLYVFAKPLKEFKGLPLDTQMVSLSNIEKTDGVMRCVKCNSWVNDADVTKCPCGGYLKKRKRFLVRGETTESLDAEYLEIQAALEDIAISAQMDRRPRTKIPVSTGIITTSMTEKSSVDTQSTAAATHTGFLTVVAVKYAGKQPDFDEDDHTKHTHLPDNSKYSFFKEMGVDVESIQNHEIKEFARIDAKRIAELAVTEWSKPTKIPTSFMKGNSNSVSRKNHTTYRNKNKRFENPQKKNNVKYNCSVPAQKEYKKTICSKCGNKATALVENKCQRCFLEVTN